ARPHTARQSQRHSKDTAFQKPRLAVAADVLKHGPQLSQSRRELVDALQRRLNAAGRGLHARSQDTRISQRIWPARIVDGLAVVTATVRAAKLTQRTISLVIE